MRKTTLVNTFLIQEDITKGQRVEGFTVEVFANGAWHHVGEGTTVGYKRLLPFSDSHAEKVRVTITGARGTVNISNIGSVSYTHLGSENALEGVAALSGAYATGRLGGRRSVARLFYGENE